MLKDFDSAREGAFFDLFKDFFDLEKDVGKQHDVTNYSLERLLPLAEVAGYPEKALQLVHVAGTKGKGTTSYLTGALISSSGHSCGVFSSPHLDTVRERFQIDGQLASYEDLEKLALPLCEKIRQAGLHPSLFEIFTVLALQYFNWKKAEYAVLETGIGGRLDATNYPEKKLISVITPLSYDHMALLGNDIRQIAGEKAGIIREHTPVVIAKQPYHQATEVVLRHAAQLNAPVWHPDDSCDGDSWLPSDAPPYLRDNFRVSWKAVELIGIKPNRAAFKMPRLRARFECICRNPLVILDAAHNGDSARRLVEALNECYAGVKFLCVLGSVPGKDVRGIVDGLKDFNGEFILTNPETPRGSALPQLQEAAEGAGLRIRAVIPNIIDKSQLPNEPMIFTGSFFTALIGEKIFHE